MKINIILEYSNFKLEDDPSLYYYDEEYYSEEGDMTPELIEGEIIIDLKSIYHEIWFTN